MALRYAVANGNWSNTATWNGGTLPTSSDDVYSNNFTVTIDQNITVLTLRNVASAPAVAGGGFTVNDGVTVTCTASQGILAGATTLVTYSGSSSATISSNVIGNTGSSALLHNGTGTLTVNGKVVGSNNTACIIFTSLGVLNINGDLNNGPVSSASSATSAALQVTASGIVNIVGNVYGGLGTNCFAVYVTAGTPTINITGLVSSQVFSSFNGYQAIVLNSGATVNISGNVYNNCTTGYQPTITINSAAASVIVTGNVTAANSLNAISASVNCYLKITGTITTSGTISAVSSTGTGAINIFSGPFVCASYGVFPFQVFRMHLIPQSNSYFEFRDNSTNGALSPGAIAPATRMVSPATVVDAPSQSNVRDGVIYALGTQTGTLKVPNPANVALNVPTDNTVGTAVLTSANVKSAVWDALLTDITTANSIGVRLKNAATVDSTGNQITALT